jgi:hypothetical protein
LCTEILLRYKRFSSHRVTEITVGFHDGIRRNYLLDLKVVLPPILRLCTSFSRPSSSDNLYSRVSF